MINKKISSTFGTGVVLIIAGFFGYVFLTNNTKNTNVVQEEEKSIDIENNEIIKSIPIKAMDNDIAWYSAPKLIESPTLFNRSIDSFRGEISSVKAWEIGKKKNSRYDDKILLIAVEHFRGVMAFIFLEEETVPEKTLITYAKYHNIWDIFDRDILSDRVIGRGRGDIINSLEYPGFLEVNGKIFQLESEKVFNDINDPFFHPEKSNIYKKISFDNIYGDIFQNEEDGKVYLKSPIGTAMLYSLKN